MTAVLTYHRIGDVPNDSPKSNLYISPAEFEEQIAYLKRKKFLFVKLDSIVGELHKELALPQNCVAITFDDTTIDNFRTAYPILKKYGAKATFFVIADRALGLIKDDEKKDYADINQIKEMSADNLIDIGSHSCTHPHLTKLDDTQLEYEIVKSKEKLETALNNKINFFCYPYGNFDERVVKAIKKAKYSGAASTIRDNRNRKKHIYFMKRVMVMRNIGLTHFAFYFTPLYHLEHYRKNKRLWGKFK